MVSAVLIKERVSAIYESDETQTLQGLLLRRAPHQRDEKKGAVMGGRRNALLQCAGREGGRKDRFENPF
jgi:hypothetical protein